MRPIVQEYLPEIAGRFGAVIDDQSGVSVTQRAVGGARLSQRAGAALPRRALNHSPAQIACGDGRGPDAVSNMQWQTIRDAKAKDRWDERFALARRGASFPSNHHIDGSAPASVALPVG